MAKQIKVTLRKSPIGSSARQRANLECLGLKKINQSKVHDSKPEIIGMVKKVHHLVEVEEV
jgi:large subunit ribosomal protein L30